jgi:uncharacterized membrane protein YqhA
MRIDKRWLALGVLLGIVTAGVAYAKTTSQIWQSVYDSVHTAIRINQVTP